MVQHQTPRRVRFGLSVVATGGPPPVMRVKLNRRPNGPIISFL
jgi:hypothetical protein